MNKKLTKVREDIKKAEARLREDEEYLKTLRARQRQIEDEEIVAQIRAMQEKGSDVLDVLRTVQTLQKKNDAARKYEREVENSVEK